MSLRDELLKVGLINKKQAEDAERKQQHQERQAERSTSRRADKHGGQHGGKRAGQRGSPNTHRDSGKTHPAPAAARTAVPPAVAATATAVPRVEPSHLAASAKLARDMEQSRKSLERADKKARSVQLAQLIKQHRVTPADDAETYNFVDGSKVRRVAVNAALRSGLMAGEILIVRHEDVYDLIPAAIAAQLRERDPQIFITSGKSDSSTSEDSGYADFPVPDDLVW